MATYTTPGVFVEEVSTLPPSVAPVPTSIPVFIGYTQRAEINGNSLSFPTVPIRITSMLEYETIFGGANPEDLHVTLANASVDISITNNTVAGSDYRLYYDMLMYFGNGGGPCYIISVDDYSAQIDASAMQAAVAQAEKVDEITMVVAPDALSALITNAERRALYDAVLAHCEKMQDRFAILDVKEDPSDTIANDAIAFRDQNVGANNLSYGGAYYPPFKPAFSFVYDDSLVTITATNSNLPANVQAYNGKTLNKVNNGVQEVTAVDFTNFAFPGTAGDIITIGGFDVSIEVADVDAVIAALEADSNITGIATITAGPGINDITLTAITPGMFLNVTDTIDVGSGTIDITFLPVGVQEVTEVDFTNFAFPGTAGDIITIGGFTTPIDVADIDAVIAALEADSNITAIATITPGPGINDITITAITPGTLLDVTTTIDVGSGTIDITILPIGLTPDGALYNRILTALNNFAMELYPSAMMAGIYCNVDTNRGVWKAPANVGVTLVDHLNRLIKDEDQGGLNVDATSGKSINAIRNFNGRGILVWGARTLDGNSNEWRYVNVRRTFLFVEDSCKKASQFVVFEPNVANTWVRVKGMISNFLTSLWRDGALAGAKPEEAFFVKVGLDETMTAQDILEGRLIVMIGMAVVRPAEFIILKFEHKLQVS